MSDPPDPPSAQASLGTAPPSRRDAGRLIYPSGGLGGSRELFYSLSSDATSPHHASTPGLRVLAGGAVLRQVVPGSPSTGWLPARQVGGPPALKGGFGVHYGLYEPGSLRRTLGTRRPSLGPPGGGCPPQCEGWAAHPSGLIQAIGRYCLYRNLGPTVVSLRKPGGQDPRGGSTGSPLVACSDLPCRGRGPAQAVKAAPATPGRLLPPSTAGIGAPGRHRDGWGEQHGWPSQEVAPPGPSPNLAA